MKNRIILWFKRHFITNQIQLTYKRYGVQATAFDVPYDDIKKISHALLSDGSYNARLLVIEFMEKIGSEYLKDYRVYIINSLDWCRLHTSFSEDVEIYRGQILSKLYNMDIPITPYDLALVGAYINTSSLHINGIMSVPRAKYFLTKESKLHNKINASKEWLKISTIHLKLPKDIRQLIYNLLVPIEIRRVINI